MKKRFLEQAGLLAALVCCGWMMPLQAADSPSQPPTGIAASFIGLVDAKGHPYSGAGFDDAKIYVLYFSASWCPGCREFSPRFVKFIRENAAANPHMAAVMLNDDKTPAKMLAYMQAENMPFPSIPLEFWRNNATLNAYAGEYIPQVVVIDRDGKILANTIENKVYGAPDQTLAELNKILNSGVAR